MEITTPIDLILARKGTSVWSISPTQTVYEAISMMAEKNIGALPVVQNGRLVGMISERDYARKVILLGRMSRETPVSEIMSRDLFTASPGDSVHECLELMTEHRVRHLPVLRDGGLAGIVSIGDLVNWVINAQTAVIDNFEHFVTGAYPA